jgi:hypothetical protein
MLVSLILSTATFVIVYAQQPQKGHNHEQINKRGDHVMGFDHQTSFFIA